MVNHNSWAVKITEALTQIIALSNQPLSVIDNVGFQKLLNVLEPQYNILSRTHVTDTVLQRIHNLGGGCGMSEVYCMTTVVSFTTHIWSSRASPMGIISLTAQWIEGFIFILDFPLT